MFVSKVFHKNWHLQWLYKLLQHFMFHVCWISLLDGNKYCQWTHCAHLRYPAAYCHLYCPVDLLWKDSPFPLNSSLMFPIANPATLVPDRNQTLTRGTVSAKRISPASTNLEKILIIYSCVSPCQTADCQLLYTNRDVTFIKITSNVANKILKMFLPKYLIPRTQQTAAIVSQYWQLCSLEWFQATASLWMRCLHFCDVTQCRLVVNTVSVQQVGLIFAAQLVPRPAVHKLLILNTALLW